VSLTNLCLLQSTSENLSGLNTPLSRSIISRGVLGANMKCSRCQSSVSAAISRWEFCLCFLVVSVHNVIDVFLCVASQSTLDNCSEQNACYCTDRWI